MGHDCDDGVSIPAAAEDGHQGNGSPDGEDVPSVGDGRAKGGVLIPQRAASERELNVKHGAHLRRGRELARLKGYCEFGLNNLREEEGWSAHDASACRQTRYQRLR